MSLPIGRRALVADRQLRRQSGRFDPRRNGHLAETKGRYRLITAIRSGCVRCVDLSLLFDEKRTRSRARAGRLLPVLSLWFWQTPKSLNSPSTTVYLFHFLIGQKVVEFHVQQSQCCCCGLSFNCCSPPPFGRARTSLYTYTVRLLNPLVKKEKKNRKG